MYNFLVALVEQSHPGVKLWLVGLAVLCGLGMLLRLLALATPIVWYSAVSINPEKSSVFPPGFPHCLDINRVTVKELVQLPHMGSVLAERIVHARPYHKVEDLLAVHGVGWGHWQSWRHGLCVVP